MYNKEIWLAYTPLKIVYKYSLPLLKSNWLGLKTQLKVFQYIIEKISISMYNKEIWLAYTPHKIVYK